MLIAIPSKSRPYKSKTKELLKSAKLFVPENEAADYCKIYPREDVIGVPMDVRGITATRNWILRENIGEDVLFVDDDLQYTGYRVHGWNGDPYLKHAVKFKSEDELLPIFEANFDLCKSLGWKIWGTRNEDAGIADHSTYPFRLRSYVTAACMGIVNDGTLFFDEDFKTKEDYEISLRHIQMFGGVLSCRFFYWVEENWTTDGGCKDYRTDALDRESINKLIAKYPQFIKAVNRKNSVYNIQLMFD